MGEESGCKNSGERGWKVHEKQEKRRQEARSLRDMGELEKNYTAHHKKGQTGGSQQ